MARLAGKKINCAVFISGAGSNLKSIIKHSKKKKFPIKVKLVISNNPKAKGINFAKKSGRIVSRGPKGWRNAAGPRFRRVFFL